MAAWHDFLGQSSRIYRASTGVQGPRIWSLPSQGQPGLPNCTLPAPLRSCPACAPFSGRWIFVGRLLPLLLVIITISINGQGEDGADRSLFCIWDPINSSCRLLTYIHHTVPSVVLGVTAPSRLSTSVAQHSIAQQQLAGVIDQRYRHSKSVPAARTTLGNLDYPLYGPDLCTDSTAARATVPSCWVPSVCHPRTLPSKPPSN